MNDCLLENFQGMTPGIHAFANQFPKYVRTAEVAIKKVCQEERFFRSLYMGFFSFSMNRTSFFRSISMCRRRW